MIILQIGFPIEENFSSYSVITFPIIILRYGGGQRCELPVSILLPGLLPGKVEQTAVVSFELDGSVFFQNLVVAGKKLPGGKAAGSVASLRPGIREIQIDSGNFAFFKNFGKKSCIHAHEF